MATVKDALELTTRTIDRRAFHFRNLVVLLVLVVVACVVWAVLEKSSSPLLGLLALVPLCGGFLVLDNYLVNRWRERVVRMWALEELDLAVFTRSIASVRILPAGTLGAMLATLPTGEHARTAAKLSPVMKEALSLTVTTIHRWESDRTLFATLAYGVGLAFFSWGILLGDWLPLFGCLGVVPVIALGHAVSSLRLRHWHGQLLQCREIGLDLPTLVGLVGPLEWGRISRKKKDHLLNSLSPKSSM
jgi:hypothetical protein